MKKKCSVLALFVCMAQAAICQVPGENRILNYRIIAFSPPQEQNTNDYTLEIAKGNYNSEDSFRKHIIIATHSRSEKTIAEVPAFGSPYTWRTISHKDNATPVKSKLYHFSTGMTPGADLSMARLNVKVPATKEYKDAYVFLDGQKALYDMEGRLVWYLPPSNNQLTMVTDLKMTNSGTITFLSNNAYEIDYDGNVLWKAPDNGTVSGGMRENYHHDFTKLANGHYMLLGTEIVRSAPEKENAPHPTTDGAQSNPPRPARYSTIIEYNANGDVVWSWKLSKYILDNGILNNPAIDPHVLTPHTNSFYFDEQEKVIYISCKELNTILKIKYPEGTVMNSYGEAPVSHTGPKGEKLFCGQHGVTKSQKGVVFIYNNNDCCEDGLPKVKALKEPVTTDEKMKIIWEYQCSTDKAGHKKFNSGGNVTILDDESLFVCMGGDYSKVFIVNKDKKILWSALPERKNAGVWIPDHQYRASIIGSTEKLHQLILGQRSTPNGDGK